MARTNTRIISAKEFTHEGAPASKITPAQQLRRSLMACMLWENEFYEDGETIASRIASLIPKISPAEVSAIAIEARVAMKLRHAPLLVVREMARHKKFVEAQLAIDATAGEPYIGGLVAWTLAKIINRADELAEFVSIYWKEKKQPLSAQVKKGLALAFRKFSPYNLAKYNRDSAVKLRDVLFLCHAKPVNKLQDKVWKQLIDNKLPIPNTWEVTLSKSTALAVASEKGCSLEKAQAFIDKMTLDERKKYYSKIMAAIMVQKKKVWLKLLKEKELGALALIRNIRNMTEATVPREKIALALEEMEVEKILPFRFITAARHNPDFEPELETALFRCLKSKKKLKGKTALLVDVSGSMDQRLSDKSEVSRMDAASGLGILLREVCEEVVIHTFSVETVQVPPRHGFALRDAIASSQGHGGTNLGQAIRTIRDINYDRLIIVTDEQSSDNVGAGRKTSKNYIVNVASNRNGVAYGDYIHLNGWSESIVEYIREIEGQ